MGGSLEKLKSISIIVMSIWLFGAHVYAAEPTSTKDLLLIANDYYSQTSLLEQHLDEIGYNVSRVTDAQFNADPDLSSYDILILTGFAPGLTATALQNVVDSQIPILVISYWNMEYAYDLGLVESNEVEFLWTKQLWSSSEFDASAARYIDGNVTVYNRIYPVYGADTQNLADGVDSVVEGGMFKRIAVGALDLDERRAFLGAYDFRKYTDEGWRVLDILLISLEAPGPEWTDTVEMHNALVASGIMEYIDSVNANPSTYDRDEVAKTIWTDIVRWNLLPLAPPVEDALILDDVIVVRPILDVEVEMVNVHHPRCGHPTERWFLGQAHTSVPVFGTCTKQYYPDCPLCEETDMQDISNDLTLDQNADWPPVVKNMYNEDYRILTGMDRTKSNSFRVRGTDMGVSVEFNGEMLFYMGDTWGLRSDCVGCEPGAIRNDAIVRSADYDFSDGIDTRVVRERVSGYSPSLYGFKGVSLPGIHEDVWNEDLWAGGGEAPFSTTNAALVVPDYSMWLLDGQVTMPMVMTFYTTASIAGAEVGGEPMVQFKVASDRGAGWADCETMDNDCSKPYARKNPQLWSACSYNGVDFYNCYSRTEGRYVPFSEDEFTWTTCSEKSRYWEWPRKARFTNVTPVYLGKEDFANICQAENPADVVNPLCELYDFSNPSSSAGIIIYGRGRPAGAGPLALAFLSVNDIGLTNNVWSLFGRPVVHYFVGDKIETSGVDGEPEHPSWSHDEQKAVPLPRWAWQDGWPCDKSNYDNYYTPALQEVFSEAKAAEGANWSSMDDPNFRGYIDEMFEPGSSATEKEKMLAASFKTAARYRNCRSQGVNFPPETCLLTSQQVAKSFNPTSGRIVRQPDPDNPMILLFGRKYSGAPLARPWEIYPPNSLNNPVDVYGREFSNNVNGYGLFVVGAEEAITWQQDEVDERGNAYGKLEIWHVISTWDGPRNKMPYGVYTKKSTIPWPPVPIGYNGLKPILKPQKEPLKLFTAGGAWPPPETKWQTAL